VAGEERWRDRMHGGMRAVRNVAVRRERSVSILEGFGGEEREDDRAGISAGRETGW